MASNKMLALVTGLLILSLEFCLISVTRAQTDYQSILLDFYARQLVAHSSSLFAASIASFTFITKLVEKASSRRGVWSERIFVTFSAFLLAGTIYLGLRILYYAFLASGTIEFRRSEDYECLKQYQDAVSKFVFETEFIPWPIQNLLSHGRTWFPFDPFNCLLIPIYLGFFFAYLFLYAFSKKSQPRRWIFYFSVPASIGSVGALGTYSPKEPLPYPILWAVCLLFIIIWYIGFGLILKFLPSKNENAEAN